MCVCVIRSAGLWGQVYIRVPAQVTASPSGISDVLSIGNGQCSVFDDLCQTGKRKLAKGVRTLTAVVLEMEEIHNLTCQIPNYMEL